MDTPPPLFFPSSVELPLENATGKELEDSQQQFNTHSTVIQQPLNVGIVENAQTPDEVMNSEAKGFIQQTTRDEGEREGVEQE